jgi:hypothetical protein
MLRQFFFHLFIPLFIYIYVCVCERRYFGRVWWRRTWRFSQRGARQASVTLMVGDAVVVAGFDLVLMITVNICVVTLLFKYLNIV